MRTSHKHTHTRSKQFWFRLLALTLLVGGLGLALTKPFSRVATANELEAARTRLEQARAVFRATPSEKNADLVQAAMRAYKAALTTNPSLAAKAPAVAAQSVTSLTGIVAEAVNVSAEVAGLAPEIGTESTAKRGKGKELNEVPLRLYDQNAPYEHEGELQTQPGVSQNTAGAPLQNFEGINTADLQTAIGTRFAPPDTVMDVGSNDQIVEAVNIIFAVYNKTGTRLAGPVSFNTFFTPVGGAGASFSDPIVLFDQLADRWVVLCWDTGRDAQNRDTMYFGISRTVDATGTWNLYRFALPAGITHDYPHIGVWPDGYYMTTNDFFDSGAFAAGVAVFERSKMLAGLPAVGIVGNITGSGGMLPVDLDGLALPPAGAPELIMEFRADEDGAPEIDGLRAFQFIPNYANPGASVLAQVNLGGANGDLPVAAHDPRSPSQFTGSRAECEQPAPATAADALQALSGRIMHRLQARVRANGETDFALNWTVNTGGGVPNSVAAYQAGVRWMQLRKAGAANGAISIVHQATYSPGAGTPNGGRDTFMASAALDGEFNLALGYTVSDRNGNVTPRLGYTGRLAGDAANTLPGAEQTVTAPRGNAVQTGTGNRWGDYSSMHVDPADECLFWYANEYVPATGNPFSTFNWSTNIVSFRVNTGACAQPEKGTITGLVTNATSGNAPVPDANATASGAYFRQTDAAGNYSMMVAPGTYNMTITKPNFSTCTGQVVVAAGGTATFNCALQGVPVIAQGPGAATAESCNVDGRLDPDEVVTVSLAVTNNGGAPTTNLVGTVANTGGVTNVSGPQNYGAVGVGQTVARDFTFRVNPALACGQNVVITLSLQDGATPFGPFTYTFGSGQPVLALSENFNGVVTPALPSGWTATNATGAAPLWTTAGTVGVGASNAAVVDDPASLSDKLLTTPAVNITVPNATITFQHTFSLESGFDGGVLEASINNGAWNDVTSGAVGGTFTAGGYTGTISTSFSSPIGGRQAWTGANAGGFGTYITSTVQFGAALNGQSVRFRFRMASDTTVAGTGWRVDNVQVTAGAICCLPPPQPVITLADPAVCNGPGGVISGTVTATNTAAVPRDGSIVVNLPTSPFALIAMSCSANFGTCTVTNASTFTWTGTIPANSTLVINGQAQISDNAPASAVATITTVGTFTGANPVTVTTPVRITCQPPGPGAIPGTNNPTSDQRAGSVLFYNIYTSTAGSTTQDTRISITNTDMNRTSFVHLFFVDGSTCSVADAYLCLTANQTASFLASDLDPGTTGYLVAVATDRSGCPINFNYLIGDEYVKFTSGHQANLAAEAIQAIAGGLTACNPGSVTATLNFNGVSYSVLPRVLALDNVGSRADGNDTLVIVNSVGGDLRAFAQTLRPLFGILYDDAEVGTSFTFAPGTCQFRATVNNNFPKTTPRFDTIVPAGRSAWMKFWVNTTTAAQEPILGVAINRNPNAAATSGAFNQGHNLHKLNTSSGGTLTIPVLPATCQ